MDPSSQPMIEARALTKRYGATEAVREVSFTVSRGEVVGFLGPNGAGKSTTMRMITGFLRPSGGEVRVAGAAVDEAPLATRKRIGYLPESAPLYDEMMVLDFLDFIAEMRELTGETRTRRLKEIVERCGLGEVLGKDIGQLSKGYRQRVGLAQAMVHDPDVLVLDEPTSGLDPNQIVEIRDLIQELGREKTVLLSTHILPEVQATCGRVLIISGGKLVADDTPDGLTDRAEGGQVTVTLKGRGEQAAEVETVRAMLAAIPGVRGVERAGEDAGAHHFRLRTAGADDPREAVFDAAVKANLVLLDLHREHVSLEDTFRRLTQGEGANHG